MEPFSKVKAIFKAAVRPIEVESLIERFDENLSPNMRALRFSITVADTLIAMGVSVADVVSQSLDITDRYCQKKVQFDISSTLITASQDRGNEREPLTIVRLSRPRPANNMMVQSIQELVRDIEAGKLRLDEAEQRLDDIMNNPKQYPSWLLIFGSAAISAGVGMMLGAQTVIVAIMFLIGMAVAAIMRLLANQKVPLFFAQVTAAIFITLVAALTTLASTRLHLPWLQDINPTLIIVGGIVMLVAGLAIVGAVEDAIDEFYVTDNARLLKVVMMTIGIVAGVLIGLFIAKRLGITIHVQAAVTIGDMTGLKIAGAMIVSAGYALSTQSGKLGIILAGLMGGFGLLIYTYANGSGPLSLIVASGIAAAAVGVIATLFSRLWRTPSTALMTAGIVPLVPGLTLYNGLHLLVGGTNSPASFDQGVLTMFNAALIALAIASGASLGHLIARPVRRTLVRARNALPRRELHEE